MTAFGLSRTRAALLVVDIQERLLQAMPADDAARMLRNTAILIRAADLLGLPTVVTQQYPPDDVVGRDYYLPTGHGAERAIADRLPRLRRLVRGTAADEVSEESNE